MDQDIDRYVKDPSLLIDLVRDVIDQIDCGSNNTDTGEKEAQLREIAKAVEKLEKMGVPVPDAFRKEKLRLASVVNNESESMNALGRLLHELEKIVEDLKKRLGKRSISPKKKSEKEETTVRQILSNAPSRAYAPDYRISGRIRGGGEVQ